MEQHTHQRAEKDISQQPIIVQPPNLNGDFAMGQRTLPKSDERPDYAHGLESQTPTAEGPDFARGLRTRPPLPDGPDYARGLRRAKQ